MFPLPCGVPVKVIAVLSAVLFYPLLVCGSLGIVVSLSMHYFKHEPSMTKRLFIFPWVAGTMLTVISAATFHLPLWLIFTGVIVMPWAFYLCAYSLWSEQVRNAQQNREAENRKWREQILEQERKSERLRQQDELRLQEAQSRIEPWAQQLYLLAEKTLHDVNVKGWEAHRIGEEICEAGGFQLMQIVVQRVRAIEKEHGGWRGFAGPTVERWWDGIGNWKA